LASKLHPVAGSVAGPLAGGMTAFLLGKKGATSLDKAKRDTGTLTNVALDRIGPKTSGLDAANDVENAATAFFKDARNNRTEMFAATVAGEKVPKFRVQTIYLGAHRMADAISKTGRGEQADAIRLAADRLKTGDGKTFMTDLQELSLSLKNLKENPPSLNASTGKQISSKDVDSAIKALEGALEHFAPALERANKVYRTASRHIDTAAEGPMGKLSDKQPFQADPAPLGKLDAVIQGSDPRQITQTMAALKASGANPEAIARALVEKKLGTGPMSPSQRVFGVTPGAALEDQLSTLIASGGKDVAHVRKPLDVADRIAENLRGNEGGLRETLSMGPAGVTTRVLAKPNMLDRAHEGEKIRRELTNILKTASPAEIEQLMKLSMFDPKLRTAITLMGMGQRMEGDK
jgi:hypothetical protein